jgi:hypothetical protein
MKKLILTGIILFSTFGVMAQVGIGTADPQATLDVVADNTDPAKADAVLVPRFTVAELAAKDAAYIGAQNGSLVFITAGSGTGGKTSNIDGVGFHYYDAPSEKWVAVGGGGANTASPARVTDSNVISNADLNGFVIYTGTAAAFNLALLTDAVGGDTITFADANGSISVVGANPGTRSNPASGNGGTISYVFVVGSADSNDDGWWNTNAL